MRYECFLVQGPTLLLSSSSTRVGIGSASFGRLEKNHRHHYHFFFRHFSEWRIWANHLSPYWYKMKCIRKATSDEYDIMCLRLAACLVAMVGLNETVYYFCWLSMWCKSRFVDNRCSVRILRAPRLALTLVHAILKSALCRSPTLHQMVSFSSEIYSGACWFFVEALVDLGETL